MSLDGFSFRPLVKDLNDKILGGRIDKISQQRIKISDPKFFEEMIECHSMDFHSAR